ncbi:MAG: DUF839 domain-containing protein [Cyclobacteriaceae bacterium]
MKRRSFIEFIGKGALAFPIIQLGLNGCRPTMTEGIGKNSLDELVLTEGLDFEILAKWGDRIGNAMYFGYNNDYIAFLPQKVDEALLWVNHESVSTYWVSGYENNGMTRHTRQVEEEMKNVGGSILKLRKESGDWKVDFESPSNYRFDADTKIPFEWYEGIEGRTFALGTLANCSGGVTPWGTILTCEENYDQFYGERDFKNDGYYPSSLEWESFTGRPTEHYGWVVEVDPIAKKAKKHVGLGRFAHECATVKELADGRVVIYSGDDQNGGCLFKYISDDSGKIFPGKLYVANTERGLWNHLDYGNPVLNQYFSSETEMLIRCREAALLVGGTPLDRPEDIEIDPLNGHVLISLTNNVRKGNYHGSIAKLVEQNGYDGLQFEFDTFLTGGEETGFSCPDNLCFDTAGNLWFASDISGSKIGKGAYEPFGNNGLFVLLRNGAQAGKIIQVASAPNDAELTGMYFDELGETLFLSVQHPGEMSNSEKTTSHWPLGGNETPMPAVVAIKGDFLQEVQGKFE